MCDAPKLGKSLSNTVDKALRAISYIRVTEKIMTRLPTMVCRGMDTCLEIILRSIVELEMKSQYAEAKVEALEGKKQNKKNTSEEKNDRSR